jgi:transposase
MAFKEKDIKLRRKLIKLRKENKQLLMENDILKQVALILGRR